MRVLIDFDAMLPILQYYLTCDHFKKFFEKTGQKSHIWALFGKF